MRSLPADNNVEAAFAAIAAAFEADAPERALELSEALAREFPRDVSALRCRADALSSVGMIEEACAVYRRALELAPDDVETLHAASEMLIHDIENDHEAAQEALGLLERAVAVASRSDDHARLVDLHLLAAFALSGLGETRRALEAIERASALAPEKTAVLLERGIALFELCRLDEARAQFTNVLRADASTSWAHHYLGLIAEHQRDWRTAERCFAKARRLAPDEFPAPVKMSEQAFDRAVEHALEGLPSRVRDYLVNVAIIVETLPDVEELRSSEPPLSPSILGMFRGTPVTEQSNADPWSTFPSAILLFQRNLQRFARDREELVEQIGVTLVHEVGHFLGLNEEELYDRGLG